MIYPTGHWPRAGGQYRTGWPAWPWGQKAAVRGTDAPQDADQHASGGVAAVALEVELALDSAVD